MKIYGASDVSVEEEVKTEGHRHITSARSVAADSAERAAA